MKKEFNYTAAIIWTGNNKEGTLNYNSYERSYTINANGKPPILGSSDVAFKGDGTKYNPEELLITALASCHMLWYLHLCSEENVIVTAYQDVISGSMKIDTNGKGSFSKVILNPTVTLLEASMKEKAIALHQKANEYCFIANSVNFTIEHNPTCVVKS